MGEIGAREEIRTLTERFLGSLSLLIGLREPKMGPLVGLAPKSRLYRSRASLSKLRVT